MAGCKTCFPHEKVGAVLGRADFERLDRRLEHDAEKCETVFGRHALSLDLETDSDFRSTRPEIIRL
ncbi:hypothetical protein FJ943_18790 [Mesorhizobium sp. B2-3-10]|nr:hypothetical protein FJ943_18790 [Mesorhizobium sp. B2-3-10]